MPDNQASLQLIELTAARLCHEFSGLVGALDNALASGEPASPDPELAQLTRDTARTLVARLKLRRAAWGPDDQPISLPQARALALGLPERVVLDLTALEPASIFPPRVARIVLNLLLLAAEALSGGGTVVLAGDPQDLFIRITGPGAAWPPGLTLCIVDAVAANAALMDRRTLQTGLTASLAHAAGIRLSLLLGTGPQSGPPMLRLVSDRGPAGVTP